MDYTFENDKKIEKGERPMKLRPLPLNVVDMIFFSKKKADDAKSKSRWESEGGHL